MAERKFYRIVELDAPPPLESLGEGESVVECNLYQHDRADYASRDPKGQWYAVAEIYGDKGVLLDFLESQIFHELKWRVPFLWHFGRYGGWEPFVRANGMRESLAFLERWKPDEAAEKKESERLRGIVKFLESELTRLNAQQKCATAGA